MIYRFISSHSGVVAMQDVYRIEEWTSSDVDLRLIHELRYTVLVEEMGKYHDRADHEARILVDEEDARSWHTVALDDDGNIAAANRMTWGGAGFSSRQIEQYDLQPWIEAGLERTICVGERTMVAPAHRGGSSVHQLMMDPQTFLDDHDVHIIFGACEPHLLSLYISLEQTPYAKHNINSKEAGYLIPLVGFLPNAEALRGVGTAAKEPDGRPSLPAPVA
ncbi:MAG: GNAT family N-acetyltransferase, partial [Acidobacteria bacterium]|nr:GNAT family N-acetyltransferase [Acidobacteriota bacterium]